MEHVQTSLSEHRSVDDLSEFFALVPAMAALEPDFIDFGYDSVASIVAATPEDLHEFFKDKNVKKPHQRLILNAVEKFSATVGGAATSSSVEPPKTQPKTAEPKIPVKQDPQHSSSTAFPTPTVSLPRTTMEYTQEEQGVEGASSTTSVEPPKTQPKTAKPTTPVNQVPQRSSSTAFPTPAVYLPRTTIKYTQEEQVPAANFDGIKEVGRCLQQLVQSLSSLKGDTSTNQDAELLECWTNSLDLKKSSFAVYGLETFGKSTLLSSVMPEELLPKYTSIPIRVKHITDASCAIRLTIPQSSEWNECVSDIRRRLSDGSLDAALQKERVGEKYAKALELIDRIKNNTLTFQGSSDVGGTRDTLSELTNFVRLLCVVGVDYEKEYGIRSEEEMLPLVEMHLREFGASRNNGFSLIDTPGYGSPEMPIDKLTKAMRMITGG
jgi:hypothetical protein